MKIGATCTTSKGSGRVKYLLCMQKTKQKGHALNGKQLDDKYRMITTPAVSIGCKIAKLDGGVPVGQQPTRGNMVAEVSN